MEPTSNKTIIAGFYRDIVRERKSELIPQYIHENYIQHSPMGEDGRQGVVKMVEFLKKLPPVPQSEPSPIVHLIEQDDFVVAHLDLRFMGKQIKVIELFRMKDGKAAEHWDVTEEITDNTKPFITLSHNNPISNKGVFVDELYSRPGIKVHRLITEGDFTAVHGEALDGNTSTALFDIYQFKTDELIGHWSVKQLVPDKMPHNNGMF